MLLMCHLPLWGLEGLRLLGILVVAGLSFKTKLVCREVSDLGKAGRLELIGQLSRVGNGRNPACQDFNLLSGSVSLGRLHHLLASL